MKTIDVRIGKNQNDETTYYRFDHTKDLVYRGSSTITLINRSMQKTCCLCEHKDAANLCRAILAAAKDAGETFGVEDVFPGQSDQLRSLDGADLETLKEVLKLLRHASLNINTIDQVGIKKKVERAIFNLRGLIDDNEGRRDD